MKYLFILAFSYLFIFSSDNSSNINYPTPNKTEERLFFIQRNMNKNTIVYDAVFDKNGNLNEKNPVNVYWIRFEDGGHTMELRYLEKNLAYGIEFTKLSSQENHFCVKIVADKRRELILKQVAPFKANIYLTIDNKISQLDHMFIEADNSGVWPDLKYIELFGEDANTREKTYEKVLY